MESILHVLQTFSISLGVGCSTVAIVSFLAMAGKRMDRQTSGFLLHIVFTLLRVAMVAILVVTAGLAVYAWDGTYFTTSTILLWSFIFILYLNALLMTIHVMPRSIGPGLQAATWYSMGIFTAAPMLGNSLSLVTLLMLYGSFVVGAVTLINVIIARRSTH